MAPHLNVHPGIGWLVIGVVVLAFDALNERSLTSLARSHPRTTWVIGGVVGAHLVDRLGRHDPIARLGRVVRPR